MKKKILTSSCFILLLMIVVTLSGCFAGDGKHTEENPAGFFYGLLHGVLFTMALGVKFFHEIQVYENHSTFWYHLGFSLPFGIYFFINWLLRALRSEDSD